MQITFKISEKPRDKLICMQNKYTKFFEEMNYTNIVVVL